MKKSLILSSILLVVSCNEYSLINVTKLIEKVETENTNIDIKNSSNIPEPMPNKLTESNSNDLITKPIIKPKYENPRDNPDYEKKIQELGAIVEPKITRNQPEGVKYIPAKGTLVSYEAIYLLFWDEYKVRFSLENKSFISLTKKDMSDINKLIKTININGISIISKGTSESEAEKIELNKQKLYSNDAPNPLSSFFINLPKEKQDMYTFLTEISKIPSIRYVQVSLGASNG